MLRLPRRGAAIRPAAARFSQRGHQHRPKRAADHPARCAGELRLPARGRPRRRQPHAHGRPAQRRRGRADRILDRGRGGLAGRHRGGRRPEPALGVRSAYEARRAAVEERPESRECNRQVRAGQTGSGRPGTVSPCQQADPDPPPQPRPDRAAPLARRHPALPERHGSGRLWALGGSPARIAALRRALGAHLARRRPLCRF